MFIVQISTIVVVKMNWHQVFRSLWVQILQWNISTILSMLYTLRKLKNELSLVNALQAIYCHHNKLRDRGNRQKFAFFESKYIFFAINCQCIFYISWKFVNILRSKLQITDILTFTIGFIVSEILVKNRVTFNFDDHNIQTG